MLKAWREFQGARSGSFTPDACVQVILASQGPVVRAVVFPAASTLLLLGRHAGRVDACALMHLRGGALFLARLRGHAWSAQRVNMAAVVLTEVLAAGDSRGAAEARLAAALGIGGVELLDPVLDEDDKGPWPVEQVAAAMAAAGGRFLYRAAAGTLAAQIRTRILDESRFVFAGLDQAALQPACAAGRLDIWLYNYLADPPRRAYRAQFAALYPLLLPAAAHATLSSNLARLRAAVDLGLPLVDSLARLWEVRPAVIRFLARKPAALVGAEWQDAPDGVARILDVLPTERMPGDATTQWAGFNRAVAIARALARAMPWDSPAALAWLRYRAGLGWDRADIECGGVPQRLETKSSDASPKARCVAPVCFGGFSMQRTATASYCLTRFPRLRQ